MAFTPQPFQSIGLKASGPWQWPAHPSATAFAGEGLIWPQACRFDLPNDQSAEGALLNLDAAAGSGMFREGTGSHPRRVSLSLVLRLTLLQPLQRRDPGLALSDGLQERTFAVTLRGGAEPVRGTTVGHVETAEGLYLFIPTRERGAVQRALIPHLAYTRWELESKAAELPTTTRITSVGELWRALESQSRKPVIRIGQALTELGMVSPAQIERAMNDGSRTLPLGEALVALGALARDDLQTALAYKMGVPWVDVARIKPEPEALAKVPRKMMIQARALPLALEGKRLLLAVDRLARLERLRSVPQLLGLTLVPVLARKSEILAAIAGQTDRDVWSSTLGLEDYVPSEF